ncbi:hypothetical protein [Micromonospora sp. NBRC 101691]|uniref:hypothetical protein n=1 Tax=Micromonospora sp. NBRC 101691 TaxID=3032198 RepID=UPI0024A05325|nr:hypothetical protein [Micromonospora sp. NBRC 101691]GLY24829.1 hypothetical protein Misp04_45610 [Micromonospora sp. NBRC 101691]
MSFRVSGRGWAYFGAILGGAVSIAANVAHSYVPPAPAEGAPPVPADWTPQTGAVVGAIFWPVALFVAVEILARVAWPAGRRWSALRFGGLVPVATVAAIVSYKHLSGLLTFYGEDALTAMIGPLAVDGLMVMATGALLATGIRAHATPTPAPVPVPVTQVTEPPSPTVPEATPTPAEQTSGPDPSEPGEPTDAVPVPVVELVREPVHRSRVTARSLTAAQRVTAAHLNEPAATHERIAELAQVSLSTVKRHRPRPVAGSPSRPNAAETSVNGTRLEVAV